MRETEIIRRLEHQAKVFLDLLPLDLQEDFVKEMYFAGGCIYCLANDKEPKDYDIFLRSNKLIERLKNLDLWCCKTENALSYGKFQVVIKFYGEPEEVVGQFDFKHNMHWYEPNTCIVQCGYNNEIKEPFFKYFDYLYTDELIFNENRARDCDNVWLRIDKFIKRGMKITKETKKKILAKTSKKEIRRARKINRSHHNGGNY